MKIINLLLIFAFALLFSCSKDESSDSTTTTNNSASPAKNLLFGEPWVSQSASGYYRTSFDKKMEIFLYKESNWQLCRNGNPYTTHFSFIFEPQLGRINLANSNNYFLTHLDSARSGLSHGTGFQDSQTNYIQIDELDTAGVGHVKGSYHFTFFNSFGTMQTDDEIAGTFDVELCRDPNYLEYQNRNLSGELDGQAWSFQSGATDKNNSFISLFDTADKDSCIDNSNLFPRVEISIPKLEVGRYSSANPNQSDSTAAFYYHENANAFTYFIGGIEITNIDTISKELSGKVDAFSDPRLRYNNKWIHLNGNFTVTYCQ